MRFILLYLFCLTFFSCSTAEEESESINDRGKTIFNNDIEGNWLSVDYINTFNKTNCIHATTELPKFWTELNFSENGQLETHINGNRLPFSYEVDTNNYTFSERKIVLGSSENGSYYTSKKYCISKVENDTLYILENSTKTIKYVRFVPENKSVSYFPYSWKDYTNNWISGDYTFEFLGKKHELNLKNNKTELTGYKQFTNWEFYTEFGYDIISFKSDTCSEVNEEKLNVDRIDFVVDSLVNDTFFLTQFSSGKSNWVDMIERTTNHAILKRK